MDFNLNLQSKYRITIVSLVLLVIVVLTVAIAIQGTSAIKDITRMSSQSLEDDLLDQLKHRAELLARFLSEQLAEPLHKHDKNQIYRAIRPAQDQKDVSYVLVYDQTGRIIQDGTEFNELANRVLGDDISRRSVEAERLRFQIGGDMLDVTMPIIYDGQKIGGVRVGFSLEGIVFDIEDMRTGLDRVDKRVRQESFNTIVIVATVFSLFSIVVASLIARHLTRPIGILSAVTERIRRGEYDVQVPIRRKDEIGNLADSFQDMAQDLKVLIQKERQKSGELEKAKIGLEDMVKELAKINDKLQKEIKERGRLEAIARQSDKMAAVGQLAAGVAHEINNPLQIILGFSEVAVHHLKPEDPNSKVLLGIQREAMRCKNLVRSLLTFSRVRKSDKDNIDLNETVTNAMELILAQGKSKRIQIVKELGDMDSKMFASANQIQQVVLNLCNNAIDAMNSGGTLTVRTRKIERNGEPYFQIDVEDTGRGISEDIQKKIFNPFFTTKEVGEGTGLGLSLAYEIIEKHGGEIDFKTQTGKGTTFTVTLPPKYADVPMETLTLGVGIPKRYGKA